MIQSDSDVIRCVKEACSRHDGKIEDQIEDATEQIRNLPHFTDMVESLVNQAIKTLVYQYRHTINRQIKNDAGFYTPSPKVKVGSSKAVNIICAEVYRYCIAGKSLGNIYGEELAAIATSESMIAEGHQFNAKLCFKLRSMVKDGQRVQDVVSERKLLTLFRQLGGKLESVA